MYNPDYQKKSNFKTILDDFLRNLESLMLLASPTTLDKLKVYSVSHVMDRSSHRDYNLLVTFQPVSQLQ